jgi:hypothetical protein
MTSLVEFDFINSIPEWICPPRRTWYRSIVERIDVDDGAVQLFFMQEIAINSWL